MTDTSITAADIASYAEIIIFELSDTGGTDAGAREASRRAAGRIASAIVATASPCCPTPCDPDCEQPCHEVHQVSWKRDHDPEVCVGSIVAAAVAAERKHIASKLQAEAESAYGAADASSNGSLRPPRQGLVARAAAYEHAAELARQGATDG
jgi:hypothetical protein